MTAQYAVGQRGRLAILVLYLVGLAVASWAAHGTWMPPANERGIWFYSALAALLLGNLLVTPFFTSPANAISYAVAALVTLFTVNPWARASSGEFDRFTWSVATLYIVSVLAAALVAIAGKDAARPTAHHIARSAHVFADIAGSPRAVFSSVFLFALITYHRGVPREYLIISLAWALFVGFRPLEETVVLWRRWRVIWVDSQKLARLGEVVGHETPGLVLIREDSSSAAALGDLLLARTESGAPGVAIALDHVGFSGGRWLRAMHVLDDGAQRFPATGAAVRRAVDAGYVFTSGEEGVTDRARILAADTRQRLIGLVGPDSSIGQLQFELIRADLDLQEGSLVEVAIKQQSVLYQVIKGLTREEILQEKNTRGFVRAQAKKIGSWNVVRQTFDPVPWLPQPNRAVLLVSPGQQPATRAAIGHFPGTVYPVCIDPDPLVTHNAAILGILGVGKSFLALELIERMVASGIKVLCLDLTSQYAKELVPIYDGARDRDDLVELKALGPPGRENFQRNVQEGGSARAFAAKAREHVGAFLAPGCERKIKILNPAEFEVWQQESKQYPDGRAAMASLSVCEITRVFTEAALEALQGQGMTDRARCCLVFEEAHSLIPEFSAIASEGDKAATNGTAKAILQGRKFGLGCLAITQRTANVTKTILNQCNTVFALRVFDATGMEFLKNYIGEDYAGVLSTLEDRHAVVFGRASSCRGPVLTRLNERLDFIRVFREPVRPPEVVAQ